MVIYDYKKPFKFFFKGVKYKSNYLLHEDDNTQSMVDKFNVEKGKVFNMILIKVPVLLHFSFHLIAKTWFCAIVTRVVGHINFSLSVSSSVIPDGGT